MGATSRAPLVRLPTEVPIWNRFFTVAPLVLVGTKEPDDTYDIAPKHMAMPLGWDDRYCFVCTPRHATCANVRAREEFTVSFPLPEAVVVSSLAATAREEDAKPDLAAVTTFPASVVDGVLVDGCYLYLECALDRVVEGFGDPGSSSARWSPRTSTSAPCGSRTSEDTEVIRDLPLLAYVSPGRFARIAATDSFPFPGRFSL